MIGLEQSRGEKTNRRFSLQTSCLPVVSHGTALHRLGLWHHSTCFARQGSLTENERPKYAKLRFDACFLDNKFSFSFRYNKLLIAQLVGRHEFSGLNKLSCLPPNWAINVQYHYTLMTCSELCFITLVHSDMSRNVSWGSSGTLILPMYIEGVDRLPWKIGAELKVYNKCLVITLIIYNLK